MLNIFLYILQWLLCQHLFPLNFCENWNFLISSPFFKMIFKARIKKNIRIVKQMFYTNYHGCHGNISPPPNFFLWKMKIFNRANFLKLFLKARIKKNIRNVKQMFYTYYHGCHGNIFFCNFLRKILQIKLNFVLFLKARI